MKKDKAYLVKEVEIGIKLKKELPQIIEELNKDGFSDGDIAEAFSMAKRESFASMKVYILWIGSGIVLMKGFALLEGKYRWHDCTALESAVVFGVFYYFLVGYLLMMVAAEGRITPLGLFMHWVSSGQLDPSEDFGPKEHRNFEIGKILICCSALCVVLWILIR